jgi:hypothetical protein
VSFAADFSQPVFDDGHFFAEAYAIIFSHFVGRQRGSGSGNRNQSKPLNNWGRIG